MTYDATHSNEGLARFLQDVYELTSERFPHDSLSDLCRAKILPDNWPGLLREAAKRLRSTPNLDSIDVSPARTTDPATSKAAARAITADNARGKIALAYYRDAKLYGGSGLSAAAATRVAKLEHLAAPWKRASELKQAGIIAATGETIKGTRGQRQDVLAITDYGVSEVERVFPDAVNTLFDLGTPPPLTPSDPELAAEG